MTPRTCPVCRQNYLPRRAAHITCRDCYVRSPQNEAKRASVKEQLAVRGHASQREVLPMGSADDDGPRLTADPAGGRPMGMRFVRRGKSGHWQQTYARTGRSRELDDSSYYRSGS
ncbi:MAG: hypothetical protein GEV09_12720 [Pseudonocardiaceae bacterium]|nr:hypothetical protein [Pseudonocardiaceae bacterium]